MGRAFIYLSKLYTLSRLVGTDKNKDLR